MSSEKMKRKALAMLAQGARATEAAKVCGVNVGTIYAWKSKTGTAPKANANGAHKDAVLYLKHAEAAMTAELRGGKIKKLGKSHLLALLALSALTGGCATTAGYQPVVDLRPEQTQVELAYDLATCKKLAAQRDPGTQAVVGALLGAALGAAIGDRDTARIGAYEGAAAGAGHGAQQQYQIVERCLEGRGYRVLSQ